MGPATGDGLLTPPRSASRSARRDASAGRGQQGTPGGAKRALSGATDVPAPGLVRKRDRKARVNAALARQAKAGGAAPDGGPSEGAAAANHSKWKAKDQQLQKRWNKQESQATTKWKPRDQIATAKPAPPPRAGSPYPERHVSFADKDDGAISNDGFSPLFGPEQSPARQVVKEKGKGKERARARRAKAKDKRGRRAKTKGR